MTWNPAPGVPVDYLLRISEVEERVGLGRSAIYRRMNAGTFPRPRDLGGGQVRWPQSVIAQWISELPVSRPMVGPEAVQPTPEPPRRKRGRPPKARTIPENKGGDHG